MIYPRLRRVLSPTPTAASTVLGLSSKRFQSLPLGATIEVSPASFKIARQIGEILSNPKHQSRERSTESAPGGCGLVVDYGGEKVFGDSFRVCDHLASLKLLSDYFVWFQYKAFKDHKIVDVFHRPGECDLTTNVDFAFLHEAIGDLGTSLIRLAKELPLLDVVFSHYSRTNATIHLFGTHGVAATCGRPCS